MNIARISSGGESTQDLGKLALELKHLRGRLLLLHPVITMVEAMAQIESNTSVSSAERRRWLEALAAMLRSIGEP